jgi:hypothetical protein
MEDYFKVGHQSVPGRKLLTRRTGQYAATLWHPLGATLDREKTDDTRTKCMNCARSTHFCSDWAVT